MFSLVTTCSGRLDHLKQTLPEWLKEPFDQIVVVDYDCPQGTIDWVAGNYPTLTQIKAHDPEGFSASRARNLGAYRCTEEWICFLDADTALSCGFVSWLSSNVDKESFYISEAGFDKDTTGALVCRKSDFDHIGGYDEVIRGWGGEDLDVRERLMSIGRKRRCFPGGFLRAIPHSNAMRVNLKGFTISEQEIRGDLYVRAKSEVNKLLGGMEPCCRMSLLSQIGELIKSGVPMKRKMYYPFSFLRYCSECSKRLSSNQKLTMTRTVNVLTLTKKYELLIENGRR